jgi:alpha-tubulin suppressor-like RCC1 family protein
MALKNNTWKLNQWYDQSVAGNVSYTGQQQLWVWGYNEYGNLGQNQGPGYNISSPTQIPGTNWSSNFHSYGFANEKAVILTKTDGTLWAWGKNERGQLGQNAGTNASKSSPVQIPGTTWSFTSRGDKLMAAVKTDGTLWMWGNNSMGALGQNQPEASDRSSPVQIPGTTWSKCYIGINGAFAFKTDGTLWGWGNNDNGQLGVNNRTRRSSPVQITGTNWSHVRTSNYRSSGVKTDGTLWSWGANSVGELGLNSRTSYSSPVQVGSGTDWSKVFVGSEKAGAIKTDGTMWTWGNNYMGTLGQNQASAQLDLVSSPVQVPGTTWSDASMSYSNVLATKTDSTMWGWGNNTVGNLGQNNRTSYSSPVQIPGTTWVNVQVIGGGSAGMAIKVI